MADQPGGGRFLLSSPQIEVALAEIRYTPLQREIAVEDAMTIRDALRAAGVVLEVLQPAETGELSLAMTSEGLQSSMVTQASGWQISDTSHQTVVTILPASVSVQTNTYDRWSVTMRPLLEALLEAVGSTLMPPLRSRAGLRYVNRCVGHNATSPGYWSTRIDPGLLGKLHDPAFADRVTGSQQQLELVDGTGRARTIRHGCFRDAGSRNTFSYLLDIDVYDTNTESFEPAEALGVMDALNRSAAQTFRDALTPAYAEELGLTLIDSGAEDSVHGERLDSRGGQS